MEMPPMEEPNDDLCEQIVQQVEFYFSDANITKDKFLLKHVKRNREGFVSLKLISSFKLVKHLTMDRPTIEGVAEIFTACGEIVLVRILRPGNPIPADIKPYVAKHPEMTTKVCALVEYERTEFAQKAIRELHNVEEEDKMKVMELTATPLKNGNKKIEARKLAEKAAAMAAKANAMPQRKFSLQSNFGQPPMMMQATGQRNRRVSLMANMKFAPIVEDMKENSMPRKQYALNPDAPAFQMNADGTYSLITPPRRKQVYYAAEGPQYVGMPTRRVSSYNNNLVGLEGAAAGLKVPANVMTRGPVILWETGSLHEPICTIVLS